MRRFARSCLPYVGYVAWTVAFGLLGFIPGFGGVTYPLGIVTGVVIGVVGAALASQRTASALRRGETSAERTLVRGVFASLQLAALVSVVSLMHGVRAGFCDLANDLLRWFLGPLAGAVTAGVWGAVVGFTVPDRARLRLVLACGLPACSYLFSVWRFYSTPMVFAFDHFVGYFAGTLYDTELGSLERLWTYRLITAAFIGCGVWWLTTVERLRRGEPLGASLLSLRSFAGILALGLAATLTWRGPSLGHYQTIASIAEQLRHEVISQRCVVQFGVGVGNEAAGLLARECSAHVRELEAFFGVEGPPRVRVYLFRSPEEKAWFMGARQVYVAKPWREEIYLQVAGFPHPVLRHELAHVVTGAFAPGPFRVAGNWGGFVPDPGRIEGFAVAAAPDEDDPLTNMQWAAAMKRLGLLPPLSNLFQLGFFGSNSSTAYTVAGAFVQWVRDKAGPGALAAWYGGQSLEEATGSPLSKLESDFSRQLDEIQFSEAELAAARARFDRPAVLARPCPYQVDAALSQGLMLAGMGECGEAHVLLTEVLTKDPSAWRASLGLGQCALSEHEYVEAQRQFSSVVASPYAHGPLRATALERQGDVAWIAGEQDAAREYYDKALDSFVEEQRLRQLDVKLFALRSSDDMARRAIFAVFFGPRGLAPVAVASGAQLAEWAEARGDALAFYLLGKQYWGVGEWELAQENLVKAIELSDELPPRVLREARRGRLISACALGEPRAVSAAWEAVAADPSFSSQAKVAVETFARRCLSGE